MSIDRFPLSSSSPELDDILQAEAALGATPVPEAFLKVGKANATLCDRIQTSVDRFLERPVVHQWAASQENRELIHELTTEIADLLEEETGESYRRPADGASLVDLVTGRVITMAAERWKRRTILPGAWAEMRGPISRDLEGFLRAHERGPFARLVVLTGGPRVTLDELKERIEAVRIRVKRVAEALRDMEIDVLLRSTEFPYDPESGTFHVHVNLIVMPAGYIKPKRWKRYLNALRDANDGMWIKDNGRLKKTQEAVKYVLKGEDLEHLMTDRSAFVRFAQITSGMGGKRGPKLVQPMGEFREWRAYIDKAGFKTAWNPALRRVVVVPRRERKAKEMSEQPLMVDPETGEVIDYEISPNEPQPQPRNVLRGLMWTKGATPWTTPHAIVVGYDPEADFSDLGSDLLEARQIAGRMFRDRHGLSPRQAGDIADRIRAAAKACITAEERHQKRRQVRDLRKGKVTSLTFERITNEIVAARDAVGAQQQAEPDALRVHNGTSSDAAPTGARFEPQARNNSEPFTPLDFTLLDDPDEAPPDLRWPDRSWKREVDDPALREAGSWMRVVEDGVDAVLVQRQAAA